VRHLTLASTDGVSLSVVDYQPDSHAHTVLFSHATGFHGRCFDPLAERLTELHSVTFDYRGYGDSVIEENWEVRWGAYGDDALTVTQYAAQHGPVIGVGHSMGGAALVMAALREPQLFRALVLYEPIIFPPESRRPDAPKSPLADGARRRRTNFASFDEALANYSAKPPLNVFHPECLEAYVRHGFRETTEGDVTLKCRPEHEARTYESGGLHETWGELGNLTTPVWLVSGVVHPFTPAAIAEQIAPKLPNVHVVSWPDRGHFGPLEDPDRFVGLIREVEAHVS
jgi:pimeloyl-ACP methyl ester carboxylesterase